MSKITFGPAQSGAKKIIVGLAGGTGSGKTYSALELGTGLVNDPASRLFVIDTEFGRASHYAGQFAFQYGELGPPFRPQRYIEAIDAAVAAGAECVIVDSLSHMWEGEAGLLDWHGEIALAMADGNARLSERYNFPAWRLPKQELQKFVLYLQRSPVHLILCLRAKEKSKMVKANGKTEIVPVGLQPIIDESTPYEATFLAMLTHDEPGVPHWTHKALASYLKPLFNGDGPQKLSRTHGRKLAQWCAQGNGRRKESPPPSDEHAESRPPAATTAAGKLTGKRAKEIVAALRDAPSVEELDKLWSRRVAEVITASAEGQRQIKKVYDDTRAGLEQIQGAAPASDPARTFADEIDELEPDEWRLAEGRVEDPRQVELLP